MSDGAKTGDLVREGLLITVSGPSGVGKGTIISRVRKKMPGILHSVSVTTRARREDETDGVSYFFKTEKEFEEMMRRGEILEHDTYLNHYYGTPLPPLEKMIRDGKDVIFDLTVAGSLSLMEKYKNAVTIFLLPPSMSELRARLEKRGTEPSDLIGKRILKASTEIPKVNLFEYVIINDEIESSVNRILSIIEAEKFRYSRQIGIEDRILKG